MTKELLLSGSAPEELHAMAEALRRRGFLVPYEPVDYANHCGGSERQPDTRLVAEVDPHAPPHNERTVLLLVTAAQLARPPGASR